MSGIKPLLGWLNWPKLKVDLVEMDAIGVFFGC